MGEKVRIMHLTKDFVVQMKNDFDEWEDVVSKPTLKEAKEMFIKLKGAK